MPISPRLITASATANFADQYYALCAAHPHRQMERCSSASKEILAALSDLGAVKKERGPGQVYAVRAPSQPEWLELAIIIQGNGTIVEPCLALVEAAARSGSNFAVLAYEAASALAQPIPTPAYPRPYFYSLDELRAVVSSCITMVLNVGSKFESVAR